MKTFEVYMSEEEDDVGGLMAMIENIPVTINARGRGMFNWEMTRNGSGINLQKVISAETSNRQSKLNKIAIWTKRNQFSKHGIDVNVQQYYPVKDEDADFIMSARDEWLNLTLNQAFEKIKDLMIRKDLALPCTDNMQAEYDRKAIEDVMNASIERVRQYQYLGPDAQRRFIAMFGKKVFNYMDLRTKPIAEFEGLSNFKRSGLFR